MRIRSLVVPAAVAVLLGGMASLPAAAAEVTLKAASCFPKGTYFSKRFEAFIETVNAEGKGLLQINYLGGAPAIGSPFELVAKASKGVYDLASCTGAYYQNLMPEADALKMTERPMSELRKNGGYEYIEKLHNDKGLTYLARTVQFTPFHLYLNRPIAKPDLASLHLRVSPVYQPFFQALGATTQSSNLTQIYTYMENGTVDGYGWPISGLLPDWHKVTKYRVDPGFYDADIQILANLKAYRALDDAQRAFLDKVAMRYEGESLKEKEVVANAAAKQKEQGIVAIEFTGAEREKWLAAARDAGWASIVKRSPEHGPKLRALFAVE